MAAPAGRLFRRSNTCPASNPLAASACADVLVSPEPGGGAIPDGRLGPPGGHAGGGAFEPGPGGLPGGAFCPEPTHPTRTTLNDTPINQRLRVTGHRLEKVEGAGPTGP